MNESQMTHAMVISAVHVDSEGKPIRYKVENSWGEDVGDKGYFVMTDAWFNECVTFSCHASNLHYAIFLNFFVIFLSF